MIFALIYTKMDPVNTISWDWVKNFSLLIGKTTQVQWSTKF